MIYLDNAATSWPKPESVYLAVDQALRKGGSPGRGSHEKARAAAEVLFETREALAEMLGTKNSTQIAFTQNATDSLNTVLFGLIKPGDIVVTTAVEHNAVVRPLFQLQKSGVNLRKVNCSDKGELDWKALQAALQGANWLVLTHASNVSGVVFPICEIAQMAKKLGVKCIIDACQTTGVESIEVEAGGFAAVAFSGHKGLLGPQGIGGLYLAEGICCRPLRYGGTGSLSESEEQPDFMPDLLESGTPNVPAIAGLLAGLREIKARGRDNIRRHELHLAQMLWQGLERFPGIRLLGSDFKQERTAVVSCVIGGADSGEIGLRLETDANIACRAGLHCAPWAHHTLGSLKSGAVRFSPGFYNTETEIEEVLRTMQMIIRER